MAAVHGDVAQNLTDGGGVVQVMFPLHEKVKSLPFFRGDEPEGDLFKEPILRRKPGNELFAIAVRHPQSQPEDRCLRQQFRLIPLSSPLFIVRMSTALV